MRARRLFGPTLAVLLAHGVAWQWAVGGWAVPALAPAGVHRLELVPASPRTLATAAPADAGHLPARTHAHAPLRGTPTRRVATGAAGRRRGSPPETVPWPTYPTQPPPSIALHYALVQGSAASSATGEADIDWQRDPGTFSLRVATRVDGRPPREWQSVGGFDAAGVAPTRLVERERGRDKRAINFDHDGARVRFSGASAALSIAPGAQDRWSWLAQLAAIAEADALAPKRGRSPATHWDLQVAGLRGDLERWTFQVLPPDDPPDELRPPGVDAPASGAQACGLLHVLRATDRPYDLRIEAWLSPALHHLPAGLRLSTPPGPWSLSLWRHDS